MGGDNIGKGDLVFRLSLEVVFGFQGEGGQLHGLPSPEYSPEVDFHTFNFLTDIQWLENRFRSSAQRTICRKYLHSDIENFGGIAETLFRQSALSAAKRNGSRADTNPESSGSK